MKRRVCQAMLVAVVELVSFSGFAQTLQRLSLKEAEAVAVKNHPQIKAAQFNALAAGQVTREVRSAYYPQTYGNLTGAGAQSDSRIAAGVLNNPIIFDRYSNGIGISQLVSDFGRTPNLVGAAQSRAKAQQENAEATRAEILLQVDQTYYHALRAQSVLNVAQETVKERQLVVDQVTALEKSKLKSALDVSFANVNLAEVKLLLVQAQNDVEASFAQLSQALGYNDGRVYELAEEPMPPAPPADLNALLEEAVQQRPELAGQRLESDAAHRFAKAERDLWFPTISVTAAAGLTPLHQATLADRYSAAGINVNIPIFNGHLFSARRTEANLQAQAVDQNLRELENRIGRDVRLAWLNANSAYQRLDLTSQLLNEANQALDLAHARYSLGLSSIVEFSQAQLNQTQAQIEQASAKYEYQTRLASLYYETGSLR